MNTIQNRAVAIAIAAFALSGVAPPAWSIDGAILIVSAAEGPMPAPVVEEKIRQALRAANLRFSHAQLASLSEKVAAVLKKPSGDETICVSSQSLCITLVRE